MVPLALPRRPASGESARWWREKRDELPLLLLRAVKPLPLPSPDLELRDSQVYSNAMAGVTVRGAARAVLAGNVVRDGRSSGVYVLEAATAELAANEIRGNRLAGIEVSGSDASVVANENALSGNGEALAVDACALPRCSIDEATAGR